MYLAPDGSEIEIADTAAKFLSRAIPLDRLHGAGASPALSVDLRGEFAAMGWFGLVLPESDGVFISCTNLRSVGAIATLEADLGVPVVSAIQASFWDALRLAGVRASKPGFGRLFEF